LKEKIDYLTLNLKEKKIIIQNIIFSTAFSLKDIWSLQLIEENDQKIALANWAYMV